ncbi:hypothetical protein [uncultured Eubacterium sp.]|uniref:hypothetical protein n=1 Tax=uncultured Eubacterium sp. TaxID=165185 RepID=UPI00262F32B3|nr:hypothetical protein [uncultured Eubacterium sp.]
MNDTDVIGELLKNAVRCFTVRRGRFYPDKNFGSKISLAQTNAEILAFARQSVAEVDGVFVKSASKNNYGVTFEVTVNGEERTVTANFD